MSEQENTPVEQHGNDTADALSAVAAIVIPAIAIVFWLSGMPS